MIASRFISGNAITGLRSLELVNSFIDYGGETCYHWEAGHGRYFDDDGTGISSSTDAGCVDRISVRKQGKNWRVTSAR